MKMLARNKKNPEWNMRFYFFESASLKIQNFKSQTNIRRLYANYEKACQFCLILNNRTMKNKSYLLWQFKYSLRHLNEKTRILHEKIF